MTVGSILLGLSLLVLVALIVARPVLMPAPRPNQPNKRQVLEAHKENLLEQIRALDFDLETGKIAVETHQEQRNGLMNQAAATLQELDGLAHELPADLDAEIELAVSRLRRSRPEQSQPTPPPPTTAPTAPAGVQRFCSQCGKARDRQDKFCAYCGHKF